MPTNEMSVTTLQAIKSMVDHPLKCQTIVQDDTLFGGLVVLLSNQDEVVVAETLQILQKMADGSDNRPYMTSYIGLKEQLTQLKSSRSADVKLRAEKVQETLWQAGCAHPPTAHAARDVSHGTHPPRDMTNHQRQPARNQKVGRRNSMQVKSGLNRSGKTIVLQIRGLHDKEDLDVCRTMILQVKGVISITFDMISKRAVLRTRKELKPEALGEAIAKTCTMSAQLVTKDEDGNEVLHKLTTPPPATAEKENVQLPDYPEDDSPIKGNNNMARNGGIPADNKQQGWNFMKSMGNFLSNSFYW